VNSRDKIAIEKARRFMLRTCGQGGDLAPHAMRKMKRVLAAEKLTITAGAMATLKGFEDEDSHVNKMPFKGILLILDQASTKPPHGSRGHRIYVPSKVAKKKIDDLIGMAVNYARGGLDAHETRHKVGVITKVWIAGDKVWVEGVVWKKDFPEAASDLKRRGLGMSMELADVYVRDEDEPVWHLEDFTFTGATILLKSAAAYYDTSLDVSAAAAQERLRMLDGKRLAAGIKAGIDSALFVADIYERLGENLGFLIVKETSH
jgi:hypothetical protein